MIMKLPSEKVANVLDLMADGTHKGMNTIADLAGVGSNTVMKLAQDFPLWAYYRIIPSDELARRRTNPVGKRYKVG